MKPYCIVSPDYDPLSGGIKVMWGLYGYMLARGIEVYMNRYPAGDVIAIYPEIVNDNPVGAKKVVRYLLNKPGVMSMNGIPGPTKFDPKDEIFVFSELFNVTGVDEKHHMFLPVINTHIFTDQGRVRSKSCVFVGKGVDRKKHDPGAIYIDRETARDQSALADFLNECEVMYCYDPVTAMTEVARLCGCRVVMFNDSYTKDEFREYEPGMNGISWGKDEGVKLDTEGFRDHYMSLRRSFSNKLDHFVQITQK